jgi:glucose uptake protein
VVIAIVLDAAAFRLREATRKKMSGRGVILSLIAGLLMVFLSFRLEGNERR